MCEIHNKASLAARRHRTIHVSHAVGTVLAHDITEIRRDEFKGTAFRRGHIIRQDDIRHLQRLGKEQLFVLDVADDEMHEDEAAYEISCALMGEGVEIQDTPREGKINLIAGRDGILKINTEALLQFNMLGEIMCATIHNNTLVKKGQVIAGTRAIPLVVKRDIILEAISIGQRARNSAFPQNGSGIIEVRELRRFLAGVVITGNEIFYGRINDAFAPIIKDKLMNLGGEVIDICYVPDDEGIISQSLERMIEAGADLLITTGGMSVDPDDVTRFAVKRLAGEIVYGSAVLPGAMFLLAYIRQADFPIPILGIPACGMYHKTTVFDLVLPRILAGENIGRKELAELGHGGLCLNCKECRYPVCPFGK